MLLGADCLHCTVYIQSHPNFETQPINTGYYSAAIFFITYLLEPANRFERYRKGEWKILAKMAASNLQWRLWILLFIATLIITWIVIWWCFLSSSSGGYSKGLILFSFPHSQGATWKDQYFFLSTIVVRWWISIHFPRQGTTPAGGSRDWLPVEAWGSRGLVFFWLVQF